MRKLILSLALAAFALLPQTVSAFSFDWGVTAGYNLSKVKFSDNSYMDTFSSGNRSGWFLGPKIHLGLIAGFGIDAAATYSQRNMEIEGKSNMLHSIEIPINVKYTFGLSDVVGVYISTGPQFGLGLGNEEWHISQIGSTDYTTFEREDLQTTWNIGAGVRLFKHLDVGLGYNFALSKMGEAAIEDKTGMDLGDADCRTNTFQIQATYYF